MIEINGKILLNSAEKILKNRHEHEGRSKANTYNNKSPHQVKLSSTTSTNDISESRLLKLQANLNELQGFYSREQMRSDYLQNKSKQITAELQYNGKALFPEYNPEMDFKALSSGIARSIRELLHSLKGIQVEIENLYALNYAQMSASNLPTKEIKDALSSLSAKTITPERVAHLTR